MSPLPQDTHPFVVGQLNLARASTPVKAIEISVLDILCSSNSRADFDFTRYFGKCCPLLEEFVKVRNT